MRELIRGDVVPQVGQVGVSPWSDLALVGRTEVPPWSDLPLHRTLYIPFSTLVYSSNIYISSFARMGSTLTPMQISAGFSKCHLSNK